MMAGISRDTTTKDRLYSRAKLSENGAGGKLKQWVLANEYGVSQSLVSQIINSKRWA